MTYKNFRRLMLTLPPETTKKIDDLRHSVNIVGLSGGKDSTATCVLLHWLEIPFKTVTAEVWWKEGVTGENPIHYEWFHNIASTKLKAFGVESDFVKGKITAFEFMTTPIKHSKYPDRIGKLRAFPLCGKCGIQRDCKHKPLQEYYKKQTKPYNVIVGLASNEKNRFESDQNKNNVALLALLGIHEREAFHICSQHDLLSPTYLFSARGGCWFCPNQKIQELELLYFQFPHLWDELMVVQNMPNKVSELFTRTKTLYDIEKEIMSGVQMKISITSMLAGGD